MMIKKIIHLILFLSISACATRKEKDGEMLSRLIHSEIRLPDYLDNDPTGVHRETLQNSDAKIIVYIMEGECGICTLKLPEWEAKIREMKSMGSNVELLFVVCPQESIKLKDILRDAHRKMLVFSDLENEFIETNPLPSDSRFHTLLLNKQNVVQLIGSPIGNPKMWTLYRQTIQQLATNDGQLSSVVPLP